MARRMLNAALAAVIGLSSVGTVAAQANHNTARSNKSTVAAPAGGEDQKTAAHEAAHVVQQRGAGAGVGNAHEHHGDHAATVGASNEGEGQENQRRKKMKKLKHDEVHLELMDETDTCPTLPCPTP